MPAIGFLMGAEFGIRNLFVLFEDARPQAIKAGVPEGFRKQGELEHKDIPGAGKLFQNLRRPPRAGRSDLLTYPVTDVVQARAGDRRVGTYAPFKRTGGHRFPALNRSEE